jgi:hypothetical protein
MPKEIKPSPETVKLKLAIRIDPDSERGKKSIAAFGVFLEILADLEVAEQLSQLHPWSPAHAAE